MDLIKKIYDKTLLAMILLLSAFLNFYNIKIEGFANTYYAACVKSMLMNFKNFIFASFDPSGFVTIDKPPLGLWVQTASAALFGFNGWSIILPQALAGVLSVSILYHLVKRAFGSPAGLISSFILACTPIFVAASRNNTMDVMLTFVLILAGWAAIKAAEKGSLWLIVLSGALIGIGFNIKMSEAFVILPAIYFVYLLPSPIPFKKRAAHLTYATVVLVIISLSWAVAVDLVPASQRPFVGSSTNNSVLQLIIGHNGMEKIGLKNRINANNENNGYGEQIGWLSLFALFGIVATILYNENTISPKNNAAKSIIFCVMWLVPDIIYFICSGIYHAYYLSVIAPPIAALAGIGAIALWKLYNSDGWAKWLLPCAIMSNGAIDVALLCNYLYWCRPLLYIVATLCAISSIALMAMLLYKLEHAKKLKIIAIIISFIALSIAPVTWAVTPMLYTNDGGSSPRAGPPQQQNQGNQQRQNKINNNFRNSDSNSKVNIDLINYLLAHKSGQKYLVATTSAYGLAADIIIYKGESAMAIGGFSGNDKILSVQEFQNLVKDNAFKYFVITHDTPRGAQDMPKQSENNQGLNTKREGSANENILQWVRNNGRLVPQSEWTKSSDGMQNSPELYEFK